MLLPISAYFTKESAWQLNNVEIRNGGQMTRSQTAICIEMHMKSRLHGEVVFGGTQKWDWCCGSLCGYRNHLPPDSCRRDYSAIILIPLGFRLASELSSKAFRRALCHWGGELMMAATSGALHCALWQYSRETIGAEHRGGYFCGYFKAASNIAEENSWDFSFRVPHWPQTFPYMCRWVDLTSVTVLQFNFVLEGCWFLTLLDVHY